MAVIHPWAVAAVLLVLLCVLQVLLQPLAILLGWNCPSCFSLADLACL